MNTEQPKKTNQNAVKIEALSKVFKLPHEKVGTVKNLFTSLFRFKKKSYEVQTALKDITFEVKQGEFFGIVGRNGSGKSTLLKIIAGIYQPNEGNIEIDGTIAPFIELGVGFNGELTGRENVYLNGAMMGFSNKEINMMYKSIVEFAELERFMDQKLKNYSSGMQVRLAFSMVVRADADILLVDEVLAVGDADFQRKCFKYFKTLKKQKKTVIFVSHDMSAVREFCDNAILIEDSRILARGSADKIAQEYYQLFAEITEVQEKNEVGKRWGDKNIIVESAEATVGGDFVTIAQVIEVKKDIVDSIAGIRIRNNAGQDITGTNTKIEHQDLGSLKAGQRLKVTWQVPNIFSDGEYLVDPSVIYDDGVTVCDWWDEATSFVIKKDRRLPYNIDPGIKVKVSNLDSDKN